MDIDTYEDFEEIRVRDVYIVDVFTDPTPVVLLEDLQGNMLPIYIGHLEALSIGNVIKNISPPRPLAHDKKLMDSLKKESESESLRPKIPVSITAIVAFGRPVRLEVKDRDSNTVTIESGYLVEKAEKQPTSKARIEKQLSKLGNTIFEAAELHGYGSGVPAFTDIVHGFGFQIKTRYLRCCNPSALIASGIERAPIRSYGFPRDFFQDFCNGISFNKGSFYCFGVFTCLIHLVCPVNLRINAQSLEGFQERFQEMLGIVCAVSTGAGDFGDGLSYM